MPKHYQTPFQQRQMMQTEDLELFYYEDRTLSAVSDHQHEFYEIYFFLSGHADIILGGHRYPLDYGHLCLIPPGVIHRPVFIDNVQPYRRIVLWISPAYLNRLSQAYPDLLQCFDSSRKSGTLHYPLDSCSAQLLLSRLIALLEEYSGRGSFHTSMIDCLTSSFLLSLNRVLEDSTQHTGIPEPASLFSRLCDYMNAHLDEDLSLDFLASYFHISKYYIAHLFKESIGISTHQYIQQKRLHAARNALISGSNIQDVARMCGYSEYNVFFKAFKKEFGMSPREFKKSWALNPASTPDTNIKG